MTNTSNFAASVIIPSEKTTIRMFLGLQCALYQEMFSSRHVLVLQEKLDTVTMP